MTSLSLLKGHPWPLGADPDGNGTNFALFSAHAERVELCIFEGDSIHSAPLPCCTDQVWHGYLPGAGPGTSYAYRVYGPEGPGHCFDPDLLLLDPYARELTGGFSDTLQGKSINIRCCIADNVFDWDGDTLPNIPLEDSLLYEVHVKGATQRHPELPESLRGTYSGLASPPMIRHFKRLGVTAINLLPIHCFLDEKHLVQNGRHNYWGYNTLAFFVPTPRYASGHDSTSASVEFRAMVRALHAEGIEVILDVVFNHTAENDLNSKTFSFRGIDNLSYYLHPYGAPERYENFSGCGNTLNLAHPRVLQLVMDSLRYWVGEMHVDGFRFDLAAVLTRNSGFLAAIGQDPLLSQVKLIAEPWDLGPGGYQLGAFPPGWSEWNDRFRDDTRAFWLTQGVDARLLAQRLTGSGEIFHYNGRSPFAGVNFITVHDGFTLRDLVSFQEKHNEQNGENNRDGNNHNLSWNCGEEGESSAPDVLQRRYRLTRSLLATLFMAQGIPILQGGDEIGRTQSGNNNAYCQDNSLTWFDWENADNQLLEFTAGLSDLRRRFAQTRQRRWLTGETKEGRTDITWHHPEGSEMRSDDWHSEARGFLGFVLSPVADDASSLMVLMNRDAESLDIHLPIGQWKCLCDTASETPFASVVHTTACTLEGHSVKILVLET